MHNLKTFQKGLKEPVSEATPHFNIVEFECKCSKQHDNQIDLELVEKLELLRAACGHKPIKINSAYRCFDHNKAVGGSKGSKHMEGIAADIVIQGVDPRKAAVKAAMVGFTGIGIYKTFTHVDIRTEPSVWIGE